MSASVDAAHPVSSPDGAVEPPYRLIYFGSQGKAEVSRLMFALAGQPFVDERVHKSATATDTDTATHTEQRTFDGIKHSLPFGQLPVLQVGGIDGPLLAQSRAIERFLARRFGLLGSTDVDEQRVDSVVEAVRDLTHAYASSRTDAASQHNFIAHTLPSFMQQLERLAQQCSTSTARDTLVGDTLTLADVVVYHTFSIPTPDRPAMQQAIDACPHIKAAIAHVADRPEIRQWVVTRPA